jgi:hypothetical protein
MVINPSNGTIALTFGPETIEWLCQELPQHDGVTMALRQKQTELREAMNGQRNEPCPGSNQEGTCDGALLICPVCTRVIGVCPPHTLPAHDHPVFDNGCPI